MRIRDLQASDATPVARLHVQTWHDTYPQMMPPEMLARMTFENMSAFWQKELARAEQWPQNFGVENEKSELLGWCALGKARAAKMKGLELWAINIPKVYQKLGVGKTLLLEAMHRTRAAGENAMHLWVLDKNQNAIDFYLRFGAVLTNEEKVERGVREIAMEWSDLEQALENVRRSEGK